jgi:hypothetical protein
MNILMAIKDWAWASTTSKTDYIKRVTWGYSSRRGPICDEYPAEWEEVLDVKLREYTRWLNKQPVYIQITRKEPNDP